MHPVTSHRALQLVWLTQTNFVQHRFQNRWCFSVHDLLSTASTGCRAGLLLVTAQLVASSGGSVSITLPKRLAEDVFDFSCS